MADRDIRHAIRTCLAVAGLDDGPPARVLVIGCDHSANLLEVILLHLDDGRTLVIHATPLRRRYHHLLP